MITHALLTLALATANPDRDELRATCHAMGVWAGQVAIMRDAGSPLSEINTAVEDRANPSYVTAMKRVAKVVYRTDMTPAQTEKTVTEGCIGGLS